MQQQIRCYRIAHSGEIMISNGADIFLTVQEAREEADQMLETAAQLLETAAQLVRVVDRATDGDLDYYDIEANEWKRTVG